jgi:signal peptidase II
MTPSVSGVEAGPGVAHESRRTVFWTAAIIVVVLDVITKTLAVKYLTPHVPTELVGNAVRFTLAFNPGAAFSMSLGSFSRYIFGALSAAALVILLRLHQIWRVSTVSASEYMWRSLGLGLAWGGAAGNLIDRFRSPRGVVDFIDIGFGDVRFWTFNVADSSVTVGAVLLAWILWREDRRTLATLAGEAATRDDDHALADGS